MMPEYICINSISNKSARKSDNIKYEYKTDLSYIQAHWP